MKNKEISVRAQNIIEHLEKSWKLPQELSPENLRYVTELIVSLQEPYRSVGFRIIAEHIVNDMSLHILDMMSTFQRKAEEEGISSEERNETFGTILPETFQILGELTTHISVQSLDDVATLSNITISLQEATDTTSASEAQSLLYEIPTMYYKQLTHEHLVTKEPLHWTMKVDMSAEKAALPLSVNVNKVYFTPAA